MSHVLRVDRPQSVGADAAGTRESLHDSLVHPRHASAAKRLLLMLARSVLDGPGRQTLERKRKVVTRMSSALFSWMPNRRVSRSAFCVARSTAWCSNVREVKSVRLTDDLDSSQRSKYAHSRAVESKLPFFWMLGSRGAKPKLKHSTAVKV
jgi:hypothetical protein